MPPHVIALVPAYQAARSIEAVIEGARAQGLPVLVVDDGSQDETASVAQAAGAQVLRFPVNRGKGHALCAGFRWALEQGAEAVLTLDADGQHSPEDIGGFVARAGEVDLLIGRRSRRWGRMPLASFIGNTVSVFWVSLFCGTFFPDPQCGFRLHSRQLLDALPLTGGRFETETEILIRACRLGLRIGWVPIATIYPPPGQHRTHFRNFSDALRVIRTVLRYPGYPRRLG